MSNLKLLAIIVINIIDPAELGDFEFKK